MYDIINEITHDYLKVSSEMREIKKELNYIINNNYNESVFTLNKNEEKLDKLSNLRENIETRLKNDDLLISMFQTLCEKIEAELFEECITEKENIIKHCKNCQYDIK